MGISHCLDCPILSRPVVKTESKICIERITVVSLFGEVIELDAATTAIILVHYLFYHQHFTNFLQ